MYISITGQQHFVIEILIYKSYRTNVTVFLTTVQFKIVNDNFSLGVFKNSYFFSKFMSHYDLLLHSPLSEKVPEMQIL